MNTYRLGVALSVFFVTETASGNAMLDRDLKTLYDSALTVVKARLVAVSAKCETDSVCTSYISSFLPIESYGKSTLSKHPTIMKLCSSPSLEIGKVYILFVEPRPAEYMNSDACDAIVAFDAAFEERYQTVYRVGSYEGSRIVESYGSAFYTNAIAVENFFHDLSAIADEN